MIFYAQNIQVIHSVLIGITVELPYFIRRFLLPTVPSGFWCRLLARVIALLQARAITWNSVVVGSSGALEFYKPTRPEFLKSTSVPVANSAPTARPRHHSGRRVSSPIGKTETLKAGPRYNLQTSTLESSLTISPTAAISRSGSNETLVPVRESSSSSGAAPKISSSVSAMGLGVAAPESPDRRTRSASTSTNAAPSNVSASSKPDVDDDRSSTAASARSPYSLFSALLSLVPQPQLTSSSSTSTLISNSLESDRNSNNPGAGAGAHLHAQSLGNGDGDGGLLLPHIEATRSELHAYWSDRVGFSVRLHSGVSISNSQSEYVLPESHALDIIVPISRSHAVQQYSRTAAAGASTSRTNADAGVEIAQRLLSQVIDSVDLILDEWFPHLADKNIYPTG